MNYQILHGDNRKVLRTLPAQSVHAIITSPPYFNLRAYAGDQALDWESFDYAPMPGLPALPIPAWRGSLGNEPSLEMFIGHLVLCLREWHRVLRDDGCCFVNLGDSYNGCVDEATEALTQNGWRKWDEISVGDRILTLNPNTYMAEWGTVESMNIHEPRTRLMLSVGGRGHSSLTTSDHRWYTERRAGHKIRYYKREVITSKEFTEEHRIPIASVVSNLPTVPTCSDALVEAVAWCWTEGHDRMPSKGRKKITGIYITQSNSVNPHNVKRIHDCLEQLFGTKSERLPGVKNAPPAWAQYAWHYRDDKAEFRLNAAAARVLRQCAPGKVPTTEWLMSLTQHQLDLFIDTSIAADGWTNSGGECNLAQKSRERAEAFQIACILSGRAASLTQDTIGKWCVNVRRHAWIKPKRHPHSWVVHEGMVWCPTTNNGSWLARRNGQVFFTGNSGGSGGDYNEGGLREGQPKAKGSKVSTLKNKDLCMVPARFALAAQADGWYVRSDIVWAKGVSFLADYAGSSMPESVTDRPSKSHEYIYLLTKSPRYFWDQEAVKEQSVAGYNGSRFDKGKSATARQHLAAISTKDRDNQDGSGGRSLRSVWVINPQQYPGAHFAVWPTTLVAPMVKAATSEHGVCGACGAPWQRVVERAGGNWEERKANGAPMRYGMNNNKGEVITNYGGSKAITLGFRPTCTCNADIVPATVLDPFGGSGTTAATAVALGRNAISIDLSAEYLELQESRIREAIRESGRAYAAPVCKTSDFADTPLFAEVMP